MTKQILFSILAASVVLASCNNSNKSTEPDACACAKEIHDLNKAAPNYEKCLDLIRADAKFGNDYAKCSAALAMNRTDTAGLVLEVPPLPVTNDGSYSLVAGSDSIAWRGQKVTGANHFGRIKAKSGTVTTAEGKITGGEILLDMNSISVGGMDDKVKGKEKLTNHLRGDEFFSVDKFPEAKFVVTSVEPAGNDFLIKGNLTLKGKTNEAIGSAKISGSGQNSMIVSGVIVFDRSQFDVRYGSGKFFENLGDEMILDQITITYTFLASK